MPLFSWSETAVCLLFGFMVSLVRAEDKYQVAVVTLGDTWQHVIDQIDTNCSISCMESDTYKDFNCTHGYTRGLHVKQLYNGSWLFVFRPESFDNAQEFFVRCGHSTLLGYFLIPKSEVKCTSDTCYFEFFSKSKVIGVSAQVNGSSILYNETTIGPNISIVSWPIASETPVINVYDKPAGKILHWISIQLPIHISSGFTQERTTVPTIIASVTNLNDQSEVFGSTKPNIQFAHIMIASIVAIFLVILICLFVVHTRSENRRKIRRKPENDPLMRNNNNMSSERADGMNDGPKSDKPEHGHDLRETEIGNLADVKNDVASVSVRRSHESVIAKPQNFSEAQNVTDKTQDKEDGDRNRQVAKYGKKSVDYDSGHSEEPNYQKVNRSESMPSVSSNTSSAHEKTFSTTSDISNQPSVAPVSVILLSDDYASLVEHRENVEGKQLNETRLKSENTAPGDQVDCGEEMSSATAERMKPVASVKNGDQNQVHQNKSPTSDHPIQIVDSENDDGRLRSASGDIYSKLEQVESETRKIVDNHGELRRTLTKIENCTRDPLPSTNTNSDSRSDTLNELAEAQSHVCKIMQVLPELRKLIRDAQEIQTIEEALVKCEYMYQIYRKLITLLHLSPATKYNDKQLRDEKMWALDQVDDFVGSVAKIEQILITLKNDKQRHKI